MVVVTIWVFEPRASLAVKYGLSLSRRSQDTVRHVSSKKGTELQSLFRSQSFLEQKAIIRPSQIHSVQSEQKNQILLQEKHSKKDIQGTEAGKK